MCNQNNKFTDDDIIKYDLMKVDKPLGCIICGSPTYYIEVLAETHMCSEKCRNAFYKMMDDSMPHNY